MALKLEVSRFSSSHLKLAVIVAEIVAFTYAVLLLLHASLRGSAGSLAVQQIENDASAQVWIARNKKNFTFVYTRQSPMVWIGGVPRSGTTLMRVILDAHRHVRCGPETRIVPNMLMSMQFLENSPKKLSRYEVAGVTNDVMDIALASMVMQILVKYDEPAKILCIKDPFVMQSGSYIKQRLFPNSKFVLMIRDGRAIVHSLISRQVTVSGYNMKDYRECLKDWNESISNMLNVCVYLGRESCMPVYYESLVLDTETWIRKISRFLNIDFDPAMLKYYQFVGEEDGIHVSVKESSTDQVGKPIYDNALTAWVDGWPRDALATAFNDAPMLRKLGYDAAITPPNYARLSQRYDALQEEWKRSAQEAQDQMLDALYGVTDS